MREWRPIIGYEGEYLVSDTGEVYSKRRDRVLKPATDKYGYHYYVFSVDGKRTTVKAHRLVARAFIENPQNKPTVNHINGIRNDNRVSNLEWATVKEQANDERTKRNFMAVAARTDYHAMGEKRNFGRVRVAVYRGDRIIGTYGSLKEAATINGLNYSKVSMCANGRRKTVGGVRVCRV